MQFRMPWLLVVVDVISLIFWKMSGSLSDAIASLGERAGGVKFVGETLRGILNSVSSIVSVLSGVMMVVFIVAVILTALIIILRILKIRRMKGRLREDAKEAAVEAVMQNAAVKKEIVEAVGTIRGTDAKGF